MMTQNQNIRNPFALLDQDEDKSSHKMKYMQRQKAEYKPVRQMGKLPFSKYEIKHQPKVTRKQVVQDKQAKLNQTNRQPLIKNQQPLEKGQKADNKKIKEAPVISHQQQNLPQLQLSKLKSNGSYIQTQQQNDYQDQKKYFLTKKHREITYQLNQDGDPPLLYDIGLQPQMIKDKLRLVLKMGEPDYDMIMNPDLAGPVIIAFAFGFLLLFSGKLHFGDIYAMFILGNLFMFFLFNFMARKGTISLYNIMSILGYCLLPMLLLGFVGIFVKLNTGLGLISSLAISLWSSTAGGNFIEALIKGKKNRKLLIVYPLILFYLSFAMIVIF